MSDSPNVPDLVEPILGWRYWGKWGGGFLCSPWYRSGPWKPAQPHIAACMGHQHAAPELRCRCGIYAQREALQLPPLRVPYVGPVILGRVALWGRVIEHSFGWRAEFAYPVLLIAQDPSQATRRIAESYGVPAMTPGEYHEGEEARDGAHHHA